MIAESRNHYRPFFVSGVDENWLKYNAGLYTSKQWDEDVELYYFNARWYDPETGRFITEDPIRSGTSWYNYVENNPMGFVDPTGLDVFVVVTSMANFVDGKGVGAFGHMGLIVGNDELGYTFLSTVRPNEFYFEKEGLEGEDRKIIHSDSVFFKNSFLQYANVLHNEKNLPQMQNWIKTHHLE